MRAISWPPRAGNAEAAIRFVHADHIPTFAISPREAELLRYELALGGVATAYAHGYLTRLRGRRATIDDTQRAIRGA